MNLVGVNEMIETSLDEPVAILDDGEQRKTLTERPMKDQNIFITRKP